MVQRTASYLGYSSPLVFLEGMLSELVCRWLDEGDMEKFPYCLLEQPSLKEFYRYSIAVSSCSFTTVCTSLVMQQCCTQQHCNSSNAVSNSHDHDHKLLQLRTTTELSVAIIAFIVLKLSLYNKAMGCMVLWI